MTLSLKQREARKKGLGGSDIAAILGLSKWRTPLEVWYSKDKPGRPAEIIEEEPTEDQHWGNILEPLIVSEYEKKTGYVCFVPPADSEPYRHAEYDFLMANPDALVMSQRIVMEGKMGRYNRDEWGGEGSDIIPTMYMLQCAFYCAVLDFDQADLARILGNPMFAIFTYYRNSKLENSVTNRAVDWWDRHIIQGIEPAPSNTRDALSLWGKQTEGLVKIATPEVADSLDSIKAYKGLHGGHNKLIEAQKTNIFAFMQDAESLIDENGATLATWKAQTSNRFDADKFKKDHPELYKQYLKQSSSRVLRIKGE